MAWGTDRADDDPVRLGLEGHCHAELPEQGELAYFRADGRHSDGAVLDLTAALAWSTSDPTIALTYAWLAPGAVFARLPGEVTVVATDPASGVEGRYLLVIGRGDRAG
ncbi:MAG: hypothetical protein NDI82_06505 [Anaeromyxobacteraceae bacterium]|nr:hypothetical protein [Anaeromyxobacteraceae bacterium]